MASPVLQKRLPEALESNLPADAPVYLEITDADGDLRALPTVIVIDGQTAWQNDAVQNGFSGSRAAITDGYAYTLNRDAPFTPGQSVPVQVHAEDVAANALDDVFSFTIGRLVTAILRDTFSDGSVGLSTSPKNGTITEPAGSELVVSAPAGQNCNWWTYGTEYAPIAYFDLASLLPSLANGQPNVIEAECELSDWSSDTANAVTGLVLFNSYNDMIAMAFYNGTPDVRLEYILNNTSGGNYGASGAVTPPSSSNHHLYRLTWNPTDRAMMSRAGLLGPGGVAASYSTDGGDTWVENFLGVKYPGFSFTKIGLYVKKWTTSAESIASYDWLHVREVDSIEADKTAVAFAGTEWSELPPTSPVYAPDVSKMLDSADVADLGGPSFKLPDGAGEGQLVPGPANQPVGTTGPLDSAKLLDSAEIVEPPFGESHVGFMSESVLQDSAALAEHLTYGFVDANFMPEKDDADGYALLTGTNVRVVAVGDAYGAWSSPSDGFYGTARDGKNYWDGYEASPSGPLGTSFGTLAGGPNRRCWTSWGGLPPFDSYLPSGSVLTISADDVLSISCTGLSDQFYAADSRLGWYLPGDFDVQVDFSNWSRSGGSYGRVALRLIADRDNYVQIQRRSDGGYFSNRVVNGTGTGNTSSSTSDTSGKFRVTRSGSVLKTYYWDNVGLDWIQLGSDHDLLRIEPMFPRIWARGDGGTTLSADFSAFTINDGYASSATNEVAWAAEPADTHRGLANAFPAEAALVATYDSLNIVDTASKKMWMRFTEGSGQPLNPDWNGTDIWVHDAAFDDGVLLVAWHGAFVRIDFNMSDIRIGRLSSDSNRGAPRKTTHGNADEGTEMAASPTNSHIVTRNTNTGFGTPALDDWAIPSRDVNAVDLWHKDGYEYRFIGTAAGMRVQKWRRWYVFGSGSQNIREPDWSEWDTGSPIVSVLVDKTTGELFWSDGASLFSAPMGGGSGWHDAMDGGTFAASSSAALPRDATFDGQDRIVRYDSYLYLPRPEGIYRIDWPSGSWTLFYGSSGSGAVHEVLPNGEPLQAAVDASANLMAVGLDRTGLGQVVLIDLVTHQEYGRSKLVKGKAATTLAVMA